MLRRILVANRGEIAMRVLRAARQLGMETVLVYSSEDADSKPVSFASRAVCVGGPPASKSYLNQESIIQTALSFGCEAIHPGYGFLSENARFAERCQENGIVFVGPSAEVIRTMGDKQSARRLMDANGIPTVPGSDGLLADVGEAKSVAREVGYPVLLKATAGGGGRGMRVAADEGELVDAFGAAAAEAASAFGNGGLYLEKLISKPRHIEVQILGDGHGGIVHLGERDCSMQRRNQKIIEESPACDMREETRGQIREAALSAASAVGYTGAGTVEFVLDLQGRFYFIEMNTRVQVEHPVTEMVTGVDIVREQLLVASGKRLSVRQEDVSCSGVAIECRINAEDPAQGFLPSPGRVTRLETPCGAGVRLETALRVGTAVSPWYDPMIAKVIVHAPKRPEALRKMCAALDETVIEGVATNIGFLKDMLRSEEFQGGAVNTSFVGDFLRRTGTCPNG